MSGDATQAALADVHCRATAECEGVQGEAGFDEKYCPATVLWEKHYSWEEGGGLSLLEHAGKARTPGS